MLQDRKELGIQKRFPLMRAWRSVASELIYIQVQGLWMQKTDYYYIQKCMLRVHFAIQMLHTAFIFVNLHDVFA